MRLRKNELDYITKRLDKIVEMTKLPFGIPEAYKAAIEVKLYITSQHNRERNKL